jgi:hypothetical protein
MALAVRDVQKLVEVRSAARAAEKLADGLGERAGLVILLFVVGLAIIVAARLPKNRAEDPVLRRFAQAPMDDEPHDPAEEADVTRARGEASIPWDQAKQQLHEAD